jgi:predicted metal-dependent hydrolase
MNYNVSFIIFKSFFLLLHQHIKHDYRFKFRDLFISRLKSSKNSNALIQNLYQDWLIDNAQYLFRDKVEEHSQKLGVKSKRIAIKKLKDRWGSITKDDVINLNVNHLKAPEDVIDYIILHELCHLKIKEHSHHYWDLVRTHMPKYQEKVE